MPRPIRSPVRRAFAAVLLVVLAAALVDVRSLPAMLGLALAAVALPLGARAVWQRRARQETPGVPDA
ncbi:MAG: hypothetical protein AB1941_17565 [Gemmatimonadota bacterium]